MVCLSCGCDSWHEMKYNLNVTTSTSCSCKCHIGDTLDGDFLMPELVESTWDEKKIESSKSFPHQNQLFGYLAELYSQVDFKKNGFRIDSTNANGFDYIAISDEAGLSYIVEVKYNRSRLTKLQRRVRCSCKRSKINYFVYRVTKKQLAYWLMRSFF